MFEINNLNKPVTIRSPSFPILINYPLLNNEIYHYDLYRIEDKNELSEIIINDRATIMYFWATWCETCKRETPKIIDLSNEYPDVQFIPLSYASPANSVIDYFSNKDYNMNTYIDYSGSIFSTFNVSATPTIVIMDKNNKILFNGYKSKRFYKKLLNKLHS